MGKYRENDMAELNITITRDYAMFMALSSNNQGKNGNIALDNLYKNIGNSTWPEYCKDRRWYFVNIFSWSSLMNVSWPEIFLMQSISGSDTFAFLHAFLNVIRNMGKLNVSLLRVNYILTRLCYYSPRTNQKFFHFQIFTIIP